MNPLYSILHTFTFQDTLGSLLATLAFALVLYAPGYLVGYGADLFGFRRLRFAEQSLWAIGCSFLVTPIGAYLVGRAAGLAGVCWICAAAGLITAALLLRNRPAWSLRERRIAALLACAWIAFVLLMLIDIQIGHKLYFSVVMADQSYRIAFTKAVVRTGLPPANPLYFAGSPAPMRYYYFWYVVCAAVVKLAHVSAAQAFTASSIWAGFGLLATVYLYGSHFFRWDRRRHWIGLGLLVVTGADLLPALGQAILQPSLNGDTEWWSVDPIDSWPDSLLWVPHHVASALCCLLAFLLLWRTADSTDRRSIRSAVALAALAFASACGLSVYVAFGFALLMAAWLVRLVALRSPEWRMLCRRTFSAGLLSLVPLAPFLHELAIGTRNCTDVPGTAAPAHVFSLSVRPFIDSGLVTSLPLFATWHATHPVLLDQGVRLLLLLPGLAMELGLYGAVLVLLLLARRHRTSWAADNARDTALFFTVVGLLMTMFISSSVITNNDFGYRAVMLPQFFLLLLTADLLGSWRFHAGPTALALVPPTPARRRLVYALLVLGTAGSLYWAVLLRAWLPIETTQTQNGFTPLPEDEFQIREAFSALHRIANPTAVVAFRPIDPSANRNAAVMMPNEYYQRMLVMDAGRQILNAEGKCATHFGGDPRACPEIQSATAELYALPSPTADSARAFCTHFGVQYLVLSAWDPDWHASSGWPVTLPIVVQQPRFRVLQCAGSMQAPSPGAVNRLSAAND